MNGDFRMAPAAQLLSVAKISSLKAKENDPALHTGRIILSGEANRPKLKHQEISVDALQSSSCMV
jgi:hypothetical protein